MLAEADKLLAIQNVPMKLLELFCRGLGQAFEGLGFVIIVGHVHQQGGSLKPPRQRAEAHGRRGMNLE